MIETILIFALGFFVAGFLALMAAPAVWRRAVHLTQKRIEASMPLSINELEAEKDRLRAEHAMTARKLEMTIEALNRKLAEHMAETGRLAEDRKVHEEAIGTLTGEFEEQRATLAGHTGTIGELSGKLERALAEIEERNALVAQLQMQHEEERLAASSRQIELVARETEVQKLEDELGVARNKGREVARELREAIAARKAAEAALRVEKNRSNDLQKKLETTMTRLSDHEDRLERRESEIVRLRGQVNGEAGMGGAVAKDLSGEHERLQSRLITLLKENRKLRGALSATEQKALGEADQEETHAPQDDDALREQISVLAAEMVSLTAALEGPGSPIDKALAKAEDAASDDAPISLAERVRALREAAASSRPAP